MDPDPLRESELIETQKEALVSASLCESSISFSCVNRDFPFSAS